MKFARLVAATAIATTLAALQLTPALRRSHLDENVGWRHAWQVVA